MLFCSRIFLQLKYQTSQSRRLEFSWAGVLGAPSSGVALLHCCGFLLLSGNPFPLAGISLCDRRLMKTIAWTPPFTQSLLLDSPGRRRGFSTCKLGRNKWDAQEQLLPPAATLWQLTCSQRMGFLCSPSHVSYEKRYSNVQARRERLPYSGVQYQGSPFSR